MSCSLYGNLEPSFHPEPFYGPIQCSYSSSATPRVALPSTFRSKFTSLSYRLFHCLPPPRAQTPPCRSNQYHEHFPVPEYVEYLLSIE